MIIINRYELMLIVNAGAEADRQTEILDRLRGTVETSGGSVVAVDEWTKRKLAYEIKRETEGTYTTVTFTAAPATVAEVERVLRITDDVVRFMTTRKKS